MGFLFVKNWTGYIAHTAASSICMLVVLKVIHIFGFRYIYPNRSVQYTVGVYLIFLIMTPTCKGYKCVVTGGTISV